MTPSSSRSFLADRSAVWNPSANREYRPAELLQLPLLCPSASVDCGLPASHAGARELPYPA
jgi:hypothetical protein